MIYKYTLTCYDAEGHSREISFKTSRILKEDAFILLETMPLRGRRELGRSPLARPPRRRPGLLPRPSDSGMTAPAQRIGAPGTRASHHPPAP